MSRRREALVAFAFLAPSLVVFLVFRHLPAVGGLVLGLFDWPVVGTPQFVGIANFTALFQDSVFWTALINTGVYTLLTVPVDVVLSLGLAVLLNQRLPGMRVFRLAFFIPFITSTAVVAVVWKAIYEENGAVNEVLRTFHLPTGEWLTDSQLALPAIALMAIWKHVGFNMLILLAGLQAIPAELEEAGRIDGASQTQVFFRIVLPLLAPVLLLVIILTTIESFQVFDAAYVMTGGGPGQATTTLVFYVYNSAFVQLEMGYAAAMAFVLFVIILAVSLLQRRFVRGSEGVY
jgi:multiple sugar transport system permease protein